MRRRDFLGLSTGLLLGGAALLLDGCGGGGSVGGGGGNNSDYSFYALGGATPSRLNASGTLAGQLANGHAALFDGNRWRDLGLTGPVVDLNDNGWTIVGHTILHADGTQTDAPGAALLDNQNRAYGADIARRGSDGRNYYQAYRIAPGGSREFFGAEIAVDSPTPTYAEGVRITSVSDDGYAILNKGAIYNANAGDGNGLSRVDAYQSRPDGSAVYLNGDVFGLPSEIGTDINRLHFVAGGPPVNQVSAVALPGGAIVAQIQIFNLSPFHVYYVKGDHTTLLPEGSILLDATKAGQAVLLNQVTRKLSLVAADGTLTTLSAAPPAGETFLDANAAGQVLSHGYLGFPGNLPDPNGQIDLKLTTQAGSPPEAFTWKNNRVDVNLSADGRTLEVWAYSLPDVGKHGETLYARSLYIGRVGASALAAGQDYTMGEGSTLNVILSSNGADTTANGLVQRFKSTDATLHIDEISDRHIKLSVRGTLNGLAGRDGQRMSLNATITHDRVART